MKEYIYSRYWKIGGDCKVDWKFGDGGWKFTQYLFIYLFKILQLKSDFITDEPKDILGALELYRNMASYLGEEDLKFIFQTF